MYYTRQPDDARGVDEALMRYYRHLEDHVATLPLQPLISVLVPVFRPRPVYLAEALASVSAQVYANWELCIVDDASEESELDVIIAELEAQYPDRVKVGRHVHNQHISATSNTALDLATGDYVALLDHDDRLYPNALAEVVRFLNEAAALHGAAPEIIYTDERIIDSDGEPVGIPFFKPGWSPQLHLAVNYTTHLSVYDSALVRRIGGFRKGLEGAQDHDLMLRCVEASTQPVLHVPISLYQWRAHDLSTAGTGDAKPYAWESGMRCVREALERRGRPGVVTRDEFTGHYRIAYDLLGEPLVSIVIPNRDSSAMLAQCVHSVLELSTYRNFEIVIVDNGSTQKSVFELYRSWEQGGNPISVVRDDGYFNFARLNNLGVKRARGDVLVLLNNDIKVLESNWLEEMLMLVQFPEIGAVGAKLLFPDGKLQHGGIVGSANGVAHHTGLGQQLNVHHYMDLVHTVHESLAVTAAALMVRRADYVAVGGLDECWVPNGYGDVDLCLRLTGRGLTNLYTPYAVLEHHESATRLQTPELFERRHMYAKWPAELVNDPFRNRNLSADGQMNPDPQQWMADPSPQLMRKWLTARNDGRFRP
jgi:glycosyltransferase involved in cell wall biosynthesis